MPISTLHPAIQHFGATTGTNTFIRSARPCIDGIEYDTYDLTYTPANTTFTLSKKGQSVSKLTLTALQGYAKFIDDTSYETYADVKTNDYWQNIYDVKDRDLPHKTGQVIGVQRVVSVPCGGCGYILPLRNITVDHQRPQSGGEWLAMLKIIRAMGLTVDGASGYKGNRIFDMVTKEYLLRTAREVDLSPATSAGNRGSRYIASGAGIIVYSVCQFLTSEQTMKSRCMDNLCNLSPLCSSCNSAKNNKWDY